MLLLLSAISNNGLFFTQLPKNLLINIWAFHETEEGWDCAEFLTPYVLWDFRDSTKVQAFSTSWNMNALRVFEETPLRELLHPCPNQRGQTPKTFHQYLTWYAFKSRAFCHEKVRLPQLNVSVFLVLNSGLSDDVCHVSCWQIHVKVLLYAFKASDSHTQLKAAL